MSANNIQVLTFKSNYDIIFVNFDEEAKNEVLAKTTKKESQYNHFAIKQAECICTECLQQQHPQETTKPHHILCW